jgi:5-methylthioadenosine/S-adenosylhomocysteine deaminase
LERGVNVALGTDAAICNNSSDMLLECRQLGLLHKLVNGARVLPAERILRCATDGGARALGMADLTGGLTPGRAADLILVDTANARMQPLVHGTDFSNVSANLVYAATGQDVTDVMVGGRWLVLDRCHVTLDAAQVAAGLAREARALYDRTP